VPSTNWVQLIKKISREERIAAKPADVTIGTVSSVSPLTIKIDQKLILPKEFITVPKSMTEYEMTLTIDGTTQNVTIHNALKPGDKILLFRKNGGQQYIVFDRL